MPCSVIPYLTPLRKVLSMKLELGGKPEGTGNSLVFVPDTAEVTEPCTDRLDFSIF